MSWKGTLLAIPDALILFWGVMLLAWGVRAQSADPATFVAGLTAILGLLHAVGDISWDVRDLATGNAYLEDVRELMDLKERGQAGEKTFPNPIRDGIRLEQVTFSYPGADSPALTSVSLHIRPGECVAIVGSNGAGKSTLVKLLLGLYEPDEGRVTVDGIDMEEFSVESRRQAFSAVFQDYINLDFSA